MPEDLKFAIFNKNVSEHMFVLFQQIIDYKNKVILRRGVEANGAMALQPVKVPGPVCPTANE